MTAKSLILLDFKVHILNKNTIKTSFSLELEYLLSLYGRAKSRRIMTIRMYSTRVQYTILEIYSLYHVRANTMMSRSIQFSFYPILSHPKWWSSCTLWTEFYWRYLFASHEQLNFPLIVSFQNICNKNQCQLQHTNINCFAHIIRF